MDLRVKGSVDCSNCEIVEFRILRETSKINSRITGLDFRRADLGLFRESVHVKLCCRAKGPRRAG